MFDLGWSELLVIGVTALIILGPRDLTNLFRELGRFTGKIRRMARDFQRAMEDAAKDSGVDTAAADLKNMTSPSKMGMDKIKEATDKFEKWDPTKSTAKPRDRGAEAAKESEERAETVRKANENAKKMAAEWKAPEEAEATQDTAEPAEETPKSETGA